VLHDLLVETRTPPDLIRFTPPHGSRGSDATIRLMNTIPDSSPLMNFSH
jgi:hypothetical protein